MYSVMQRTASVQLLLVPLFSGFDVVRSCFIAGQLRANKSTACSGGEVG